MPEKEVGEVETVSSDIKKIEWRISDFFSITKDQYHSPYVCPSFSFADSLWHLRLYPHSSKYIEIFLRTNIERKYSIEYNFGFKKCDGKVEELASGCLEKDESCSGHTIRLMKEADLPQRKSELVPNDVLTVTCTLKLIGAASNFNQHAILDHTKPLKLIRLDKLSENFKELFEDKESCDVTLKLQDKEYKAHKFLLIARSSVFAANFKHDTLERQTGSIAIPDCDPDSFQIFLEYLYCGKVEELSFPNAMNLYYTSNKYDVGELKSFCIDYLMQNLTIESVCETAAFADKYDETQLFSAVQDFFNNNVCKISETPEWESLMQKDYLLANKLLKEMLKVKIKE